MHLKYFFLIAFTLHIYLLQSQSIEWPAYGGDQAGKRYLSFKQVNTKNVMALKVAWTFRTGELEEYKGNDAADDAAFEATPVMSDGVLYFSTPSCKVFAIDAESGKQKWVFHPHVNLKEDLSEITSRGVSIWPQGIKSKSNKQPKRIFIATIDGRLIALDAHSGKPVSSFGNQGLVDLREGIGRISVTSPPAVVGDVIVVGSSMGDNQRLNYEPGTVQAYNAVTGNRIWSWDPIPRASTDTAFKEWKGAKAQQTGAANAWAVISADVERDIVYIPTSSPSPDYYGGERVGRNNYANSVVAMRASTGKMLWSFQAVHHDLWDYDIAAQPVLFDLRKDGAIIPALALGTKMGHIFILNRFTGEPVYPVEERAVPASELPGESSYPTQPFPLLPAPLGLQKLTVDDAWGLTIAALEKARKRIQPLINHGIFTPPGLKATAMTPGNVGGIHWGGMCYDPVQQILVTNVNRLAALINIIPREKLDEVTKGNEELIRSETGMQTGTPYVMKRDYLFTVDETGIVMQTAPPWGTLVGIDLSTGKQLYEKPLGYMMNPEIYPEAKNWGSLNLGGAMVTAGGLTFIAATRDDHLRAFETATGKLLWEQLLPASAQATPMSYVFKGKQYIVIAGGGHGKFDTKQGDYVIAYALP
jgi:quinoprotein glucose dehydrogenase